MQVEICPTKYLQAHQFLIFLLDLIMGQTHREEWTCAKCHTPLTNHPELCQDLSTNGCVELDVLKDLYQELVPNGDLDMAMVMDWGRFDMSDLFDEEQN